MVMVVVDVAFSILRAVIPSLEELSVVNLLRDDKYRAPHDQRAPMIFLQDVRSASSAA